MTEHTPTPWVVIPNSDGTYDICHESRLIGTLLFEDDARLTVRACNSHDEMVAALEERGCEVDRIAPCLRVYDFLPPSEEKRGLFAPPPCATCAALAKAHD